MWPYYFLATCFSLYMWCVGAFFFQILTSSHWWFDYKILLIHLVGLSALHTFQFSSRWEYVFEMIQEASALCQWREGGMLITLGLTIVWLEMPCRSREKWRIHWVGLLENDWILPAAQWKSHRDWLCWSHFVMHGSLRKCWQEVVGWPKWLVLWPMVHADELWGKAFHIWKNKPAACRLCSQRWFIQNLLGMFYLEDLLLHFQS